MSSRLDGPSRVLAPGQRPWAKASDAGYSSATAVGRFAEVTRVVELVDEERQRMQPITNTCLPRPDVLEGGLADNHFAAQLDQVVRNPDAYPVYGNPDDFFALSYPTQGLKDMMARAFGRLSGAKIEGAQHGVIRSETSFGGGKSERQSSAAMRLAGQGTATEPMGSSSSKCRRSKR
jgi:hypothetical protein